MFVRYLRGRSAKNGTLREEIGAGGPQRDRAGRPTLVSMGVSEVGTVIGHVLIFNDKFYAGST